MAYSIPVLAADRVVHFVSRATFAEALQATLSAQWIFVSPRLTVRLHHPVHLELRLDSDRAGVSVLATPRYWRSSYLGMQVEPLNDAGREAAVQLLEKIRAGLAANPETEEPSVAGAMPVSVEQSAPGAALPASSQPPVGFAAAQRLPSPVDEFPIRAEVTAPGLSPQVAPPLGLRPATQRASSSAQGPAAIPSLAAPPSAGTPSRDMPGRDAGEQLPFGTAGRGNGDASFREEPTQPGMHAALSTDGSANIVGLLSSQLTDVSQHGLVPAWGVTDEGLWNDVFQGDTGHTPGPQNGAALEGEFVPMRIEEVAAEPLYISARLLLMPDEVRLYTLLMALGLKETTCRVTIESGGKSGLLLLRRGMLVSIDPPGQDSDSVFAAQLRDGGLVAPELMEEAQALALADQESLGVKLYEKGALTLDVLTERLKDLREGLLLSLLENTPSGSFRIDAGIDTSKRRDPVRVNLVWSLAAYLRKRIYGCEEIVLQRLLEPYLDRFPRHRDNFTFPREALCLSSEDSRLVEKHLIGRAPLGSLLEHEDFARREAQALLVLLHHFGFLDWLEESLTSDGAASVEAYLERRLRNLKALGHFERLDVHWATPPSKLELGMRMVVNRFGPQSHLARHSSASARLCAQIVALCQESYAALLVPEARRKHRISRYGESKMQYAAKFLARQASQLFERGLKLPAIQMLESAIDLVPEAEWEAQLAHWKEITAP